MNGVALPIVFLILVFTNHQGTASSVSSTNVLGSSFVYTPKHHDELSSSGQVHMLQTSSPQFPERPDQPECQYYMKTGTCKFGQTCKFHHPKERIAPLVTSALGPFGLPLRPGQAVCTFYNLYGICKFGSTCKFDHPTGFYNYNLNMPTLSIPDPPNFSYQKNSSTACSSENSPSILSRSPDQNGKPEATTTKHQNMDTKASDDPSQQAASSAPTSQTLLEPLQDKSE